MKIIWLSPNEWLVEIYEVNEYFNTNIFKFKKISLNSESTSVTDVTESKTTLELSGQYLYKLLSKFMIINLDKVLDKIVKSSVAQTIFVKMSVLLIIRNHDKKSNCRIFYLHI